jgi:hypothetical protein
MVVKKIGLLSFATTPHFGNTILIIKNVSNHFLSNGKEHHSFYHICFVQTSNKGVYNLIKSDKHFYPIYFAQTCNKGT